jgi:hypothetical protein
MDICHIYAAKVQKESVAPIFLLIKIDYPYIPIHFRKSKKTLKAAIQTLLDINSIKRNPLKASITIPKQ